jgi:hypothetical protein
LPTPHLSPRNPWFEEEVLEELRGRVGELL